MKKEMTVGNLRWHVESLSAAFEIAVVFDETLRYEEAGALVLREDPLMKMLGASNRAVVARPIVDEATYAVVMHEIGHHLAPNGYCLHPMPKPSCHPRERFAFLAAKLTAEEAAWDWARYYIEQVFFWTAAMEQVKQYGLGTYQTARRLGR